MKTIFYYFLALLPLCANAADVLGVKVIDCTARRTGDLVDLNFLLDCSNIAVSPNEQLRMQPVLTGENDTLYLPPVLFSGSIRDKVNSRRARFGGETSDIYTNYTVKHRTENGMNRISYSRQFPFQEWMYGSRLVLISTVSGCADCQRRLADIPLAYIPRQLKVSYMVPKPEQKIRHKDVSLYLNFYQGKSDILPDYMNNRIELAKTDSLIAELSGDPYIKVDSITIIGYASPEGNYAYNTRLSGNRAQALKQYLERKYTPKGYVLTTSAASEDWQGLRDSIAAGNLPFKIQLLAVIDSISDPDARDNYIRELDNGATYAYLLDNFYPALRRVVCDACYVVQPFTTEQAKQRLSAHPEQLSLNEMYLIARSYPPGSTNFNALFAEMLSLYPDNAVAKNNLAAVALEAGNTEQAKRCLEGITPTPEVENNLGVLHYCEGKPEEAGKCFKKACAGGCKEAARNLQEINTLMAIQQH